MTGELPHLKYVPTLSLSTKPTSRKPSLTYSKFLKGADSITLERLAAAESSVQAEDVVNVQFTSGTTGSPKAALLTHQ
jgi:acyl-CoA synthetase (AMP-forming)/AMP-acid ligase II